MTFPLKTCRSIFLAFLALSAQPLSAAPNFDLFPARSEFFSPSSLEFRYYLFTGHDYKTSKPVMHGNLGLEFPVVKYTPWNISTGIAAAAHIVMYPKEMRFPVDNLYATLATYIDYRAMSTLFFRFYPVYHVSGHLADGTMDTNLSHPVAVSGEMTRLEADLTPLRGLSVSLGYGHYYHVCAQHGLTNHADLGLQVMLRPEKTIRPYVIIIEQFESMGAWYSGFDMESGVEFHHNRHFVGFSLRFFDRMNPGYYMVFKAREKGLGLLLDFQM